MKVNGVSPAEARRRGGEGWFSVFSFPFSAGSAGAGQWRWWLLVENDGLTVGRFMVYAIKRRFRLSGFGVAGFRVSGFGFRRSEPCSRKGCARAWYNRLHRQAPTGSGAPGFRRSEPCSRGVVPELGNRLQGRLLRGRGIPDFRRSEPCSRLVWWGVMNPQGLAPIGGSWFS